MVNLKVGQEVELEYGGKAIVKREIGRGGQGSVYLVEYNGMEWALKWYDSSKFRDIAEFRKNLKNIVSDGSPYNKFVWPKYLTKQSEDGQFGCLTEMVPESFDSFVNILRDFKVVTDPLTSHLVRKPVRFTRLYAMVTAAINIVNTFRKLHTAGKCFQYLNDGAFFVNIETGAVLIGSCDNITAENMDMGITGKPGYTAPEYVLGKAKPSRQTDYYALAVALFKVLFRGDPLEGRKVVMDICLTEEDVLKHYGEKALFVMHPDDDSNRPVRGIHDNIIKFWDTYPEYIKDAFVKSFTEGISDPEKRLDEDQWQEIFIRLRSEIIQCDICGRTNFVSLFDKIDSTTYKCPKCGYDIATIHFSNYDWRLPVYKGRKFYECEINPFSDDFLSVSGEVVENKLRPGVMGIKNCSSRTWKAKMPDGQFHDVGPGKGFPLWQGLEIDFGRVKAKM